MVQSVKRTVSTHVQQEFVPPYTASIADTGLKEGFLEELILKDIYLTNFALGREISARTHLPFKVVEEILEYLKRQLLIEVRTSGGLADYEYTPTEKAGIVPAPFSITTLTPVPARYPGAVMLTL